MWTALFFYSVLGCSQSRWMFTLDGNGIEGTIERLWGILCKNSFHDLLDHNLIFNPGIRSSNIYCSFCVSLPVLTNYKNDPLSFSFSTWSIQRFTNRGSLKSWPIEGWIFIIRSGCWWIRHRWTLRVYSVFKVFSCHPIPSVLSLCTLSLALYYIQSPIQPDRQCFTNLTRPTTHVSRFQSHPPFGYILPSTIPNERTQRV